MFAFLFLNAEQRNALKLVYEFCRVVDDIVDEREPGPAGNERAQAELDEWRAEIGRIYAEDMPHTELGRGLQITHATFHYPREGFDEIIAGCEMDLQQSRYADQTELERYCYRVASCVGLLCIAIFGDQSPAARDYAIHLGLALQYTNILRDVAEDAARGRIYLPQSLLEAHGLTADDILRHRYDDRFLAAAQAFADTAEAEYQAAWVALRGANRRVLVPAEVMARTYYGILAEIRAHNFNVFTHRASLRRRDKIRAAAVAIARNNMPELKFA